MRTRRPERSAALGLLLVGCIAPGSSASPVVDPTTLPVPEITEVSLRCLRDEGRWRVRVDASAWAGGGTLVWTPDGTYTERHDGLRSVRAAADGLGDELVLDVSIVDDIRGARDGRTVLRCAAEPAAAVLLTTLDGARADCVQLQDDPRLQASGGLPDDCDRLLLADTDAD